MKTLRTVLLSGVAAVSFASASVALADSVVSPGGKPGVATKWTKGADGVTLTLKEGFDPAAVAEAIGKGVPGAKAKAAGAKVVVSGVDEKKLIAALEKVQVEAGDDVNAMFAAMQKPGGGGDEEGSGSSIRATNKTTVPGGEVTEQVSGTVVDVKYGTYPHVAVVITVDESPDGSEAKKGAKITVLPIVKMAGKAVDSSDEASKTNIGAWYARAGDKVTVKLTGKPEKGAWQAVLFERKPK